MVTAPDPTARHDAAMAENARRIEVCEAATVGKWTFADREIYVEYPRFSDFVDVVSSGHDYGDEPTGVMREADGTFIALHDPAAMLTLHRAMRDILARHGRTAVRHTKHGYADCCEWCDDPWPCPDAEAAMRCYETEAGE